MATAVALPRRWEIGPSSARSLLLTILGEYVRPQGDPVWTGTLVAALRLFGVAEKAARQALARTAAEGWLASTKHGRLARWQLTPAGRGLPSQRFSLLRPVKPEFLDSRSGSGDAKKRPLDSTGAPSHA